LSKGGVCQLVELNDGGLDSFGREIFFSRRRTIPNVGQGASDKKSDGNTADNSADNSAGNSHAGTSRSDEVQNGMRVETVAIVSQPV